MMMSTSMPGGIRRTEHLDHISLHRLPTIGIARDARQDDVAVMGPARMPISNEEVVHARILCDDHGQRVVDLERTDEVFGRATHHACDLGGSLASIGHVTRAHPKLHLVAGHGAAKRRTGTKKLPRRYRRRRSHVHGCRSFQWARRSTCEMRRSLYGTCVVPCAFP